MRRVTAILSVAAMVVMTAGLVAQTKPSFAGEWKVASALETGGSRSGGPGIDLTITQDAGVITLAYRGDGQATTPVKHTYKLDGSPSRNVMAGRTGGTQVERVSKATWSGNTIVVTTATGAGEEKRTFTLKDDALVVDTSAPGRVSGAKVTTVTYKRYERGHGG